MAPSLLQGSSPRPPRRGTRIYHPISSYVPFFIFVLTLAVMILVIVMLVGRLLTALPSSGVGVAATSTPTSHAAIGPEPPTTPVGQVASSPFSTPPPLVFSQSVDANGSPVGRSTSFVATVPRVYALVTLHQVPAAAEVRFVWTYRAPTLTTLADVREHQQGPAYGAYTFVSYATPNGQTFVTGEYTVSVTLAGHPAALGHFRIVPG